MDFRIKEVKVMLFDDIDTFFERYDDALIEAHQKFNEVGCFPPIDFYVDTVLKRAMVINGAYVKLAKTNNYIAAAPYTHLYEQCCAPRPGPTNPAAHAALP